MGEAVETAQIDSFLAVVDEGSFTRAAARLHRSQPGVSRQIQRLEEELGESLLTRSGGRVSLTTAGQKFEGFARETMRAPRALEDELRSTPDALSGVLRIAASTTPGQYLVPSMVGAFTAQHPNVQPKIAITDSATVVQDVSAGGFDAGFVGIQKPHPKLEHYVFAHDEVVLAVPRTHRFAGRRSVPLDELEGERFLEREQGSGTRDVVMEALVGEKRTLPSHKTAMVLSTTEAVAAAVEQGQGIGWVSYRALEHHDESRVAVVRIRGKRLLRPLYLIHQPVGQLSEPVRTFVGWVRASYPGPRGGAA